MLLETLETLLYMFQIITLVLGPFVLTLYHGETKKCLRQKDRKYGKILQRYEKIDRLNEKHF